MAVLSQVRALLILSLLGLCAIGWLAPSAHAQLKCKQKAEDSDLDGCCLKDGLDPRTTPAISFLKMGKNKDGKELYILRTQHPKNPNIEATALEDDAPGGAGRMLFSNVSLGRARAVDGNARELGDDPTCEQPGQGCRSSRVNLEPLTQKKDQAPCWRAEKLIYASYSTNENSAKPQTPGNPIRAYGDADRLCNKLNLKKPPPNAYANPLGDKKNDITGRKTFNMPDSKYGVTPEAGAAPPAVRLENLKYQGSGPTPWSGEVNNEPLPPADKQFAVNLVSDAQAAGGAQQFISILVSMLKRFTANSFQSAGKTGFEDVGQRALTGLPMVSMFSTFLSPQNFQGNFPAILMNRGKSSLGFEKFRKMVGATVVTPAYAVYDPNDFRPGQELQLAERVWQKTPEEWAAAKAFGLSVTNEALAAPGLPAGGVGSLVERFRRYTNPDIFKAIYKEEGGEYIKNLSNTGDFNPLLSGFDNFSGIIPMGGLNMQNIMGMLVGQIPGALQDVLKGAMGKQTLSQQNQEVQQQFFDGIMDMRVNDLGQDAMQLIPANLRNKLVKDLPANLQQALREHYANKQIAHNGEREQQLLSNIVNRLNVGNLLGGGGGGGGGAMAALQNALQNALKPLSQRLLPTNFQDLFKTNFMQIMRGDHPFAPMQHALFQDRKKYSPCTSGDCYATRNFKLYSATKGPAPVWPAYYPTSVENGMNGVRLAGTLDSRQTGNDPIGVMIQPMRYDLINTLLMQRIHYNSWCHADRLGWCIGRSCPPKRRSDPPKPCPPEIPCWSPMCWGRQISFETPPCATRHDAPHDIGWQLKDPACPAGLAPSSCRYCHHPRLKTKIPNPADRPLGFWAVANKADLDLSYPIAFENRFNIWELARFATTPLPIGQKLALCDTKKVDDNRQFIGDGTDFHAAFGNDMPYPLNPETGRVSFQPGAGLVDLFSQRGSEVYVCANKDAGNNGGLMVNNDSDRPNLNLAKEINTNEELSLLVSSSIAALHPPAGQPSSQLSYGGLGGLTGGCNGQTGTGPMQGQFGEVMMYQMNCFRMHGLRCMCKYERAFMPWDQSGGYARALGADVSPVSTDKAPWAPQSGGDRNLTRLVRMTASCPGHLTEANPGSRSAPFKHVAKWEPPGLDGILNIQRASAAGAVIHGPKGFGKGGAELLPDLAVVVRAGRDDTGPFIDVVRFNGGRFPDAAGITNEIGFTHLQRWRPGEISQYAKADNDKKKRWQGDSCSDTSAYECSMGELWNTVQWFDQFNCQNRNDASCQQAAAIPGKDTVAEAK